MTVPENNQILDRTYPSPMVNLDNFSVILVKAFTTDTITDSVFWQFENGELRIEIKSDSLQHRYLQIYITQKDFSFFPQELDSLFSTYEIIEANHSNHLYSGYPFAQRIEFQYHYVNESAENFRNFYFDSFKKNLLPAKFRWKLFIGSGYYLEDGNKFVTNIARYQIQFRILGRYRY